VNLFLDANVALAACGRPVGASRAIGVLNAIRKTPDEVTPNLILNDAPDGRPFENYSRCQLRLHPQKRRPIPALADCSIDQPLRTRPPLRQRSGVSCPQSGSNLLDYFCPINEICFAGAHRSPAFPDFIQMTPLNAWVCFTREAGEEPFHQPEKKCDRAHEFSGVYDGIRSNLPQNACE
jgi:hypothetical protein